ncbi:hypothetical protein [Marinoscillum sp.]|uniref:hypothetical protein n=1 Tax=Marinoscillum sp. TaxID=2024838 RepID=UPI003BABEA81
MKLVVRICLLWSLAVCSLHSIAQTEIFNIGGPKFLQLSEEVPADLTSQRALVVISVPTETQGGYDTRGNWRLLAQKSHKLLRQIGVDPVGYVYVDDLNAGPEVKNSFLELMRARRVKNILYVSRTGTLPNEEFMVMVTPFSEAENGYIASGQQAWKETHQELERVMIRLGRQVLRQQIERSNFLIPEGPEYLNDLAVFNGTRYENYPTRLQSLKLAVIAFQKIKPSSDMDEEALSRINYYNSKVDQKNALLKEILKNYPYKYELVDVTDEDELYREGFQYALMPLQSTGRSIKRILNYQNTSNETHQMSTTYKVNGEVILKKIPADANVTKYYIKQTIIKDIHVGDVWDADVSWDQALNNFVFNLRKAFKR